MQISVCAALNSIHNRRLQAILTLIPFVLVCRHLSRISDCAWDANDPWMVASVAEDNMVHVWQMVSTFLGSCMWRESSPVGHSKYLSSLLPPWLAGVSCLLSLQQDMCAWLLHFLAHGSEVYLHPNHAFVLSFTACFQPLFCSLPAFLLRNQSQKIQISIHSCLRLGSENASACLLWYKLGSRPETSEDLLRCV